MAAFALPIIGGLSSLLGGFMGSGAAKHAAGLEAGVTGQNSNQLIGVGQQMMGQELGRTKPYIQGGQQAFNTLMGQLKTPGQGLLQPYQSFQAPTGVTMQNDPGYQFRLQQGMDQMQNSAAARGDLLSGNTLQSLNQFNQDYASNEYGNVYNRAIENYGTNAQNFYTGQGNEYSRLMGAGGMGLQAAGMANQANQSYQNLYGNAMNMSNQAGQEQAAGIMGSNNAWQQALGGIGNTAQFASMMNMLGPQGGGGGGGAPPMAAAMSALPYAAPSGGAAFGLGSSMTGGGFGIGGYGTGYPNNFNQSGY